MKALLTFVARLAFLALVIGCLVVAYLVMTGRKWHSPRPRSEQKEAATKTWSDQWFGIQPSSGGKGSQDAKRMYLKSYE
jgi:hypothetical protein